MNRVILVLAMMALLVGTLPAQAPAPASPDVPIDKFLGIPWGATVAEVSARIEIQQEAGFDRVGFRHLEWYSATTPRPLLNADWDAFFVFEENSLVAGSLVYRRGDLSTPDYKIWVTSVLNQLVRKYGDPTRYMVNKGASDARTYRDALRLLTSQTSDIHWDRKNGNALTMTINADQVSLKYYSARFSEILLSNDKEDY